jgi:hypothetical protein
MAERTPAEMLRTAAEVLTEDSPVHAPGRARVVQLADDEGDVVWWISICDQHDDPANAPRTDANGHCSSCVFAFCRDKDLAFQLAALINARRSLAGWLKQAAKAWTDEVRGDRLHDTCDGAVGEDCWCFDRPIAVARALLAGRND